VSTITERLLERHRVDSERMWPAPSDLDLLAAAEIEGLREFIEFWIFDGRLQTFEDRERFRKAARAALQPKEPK